MKLTVIADDRRVVVDGDPRIIEPDIVIPEDIHAIQWDGFEGEIEFKRNERRERPENERFRELGRFMYLVDAHTAAIKRDELKREQEEKDRLKAEQDLAAARERPREKE